MHLGLHVCDLKVLFNFSGFGVWQVLQHGNDISDVKSFILQLCGQVEILHESSGEGMSRGCDDKLSQHETPVADDDQSHAAKYLFQNRNLVETCFTMTKLLGLD